MTYAPPKGSQTEFESIMTSVTEVLDNDPAGKAIPDKERRETIAAALSKYGGKTFVANPDDDFVDMPADEEDDAGVDVRPLTIPAATSDRYWYEPETDAAFVEHYILSRVKLGSRLPGGLLITGPAGSGKTQGVIRAVERINKAHPELGLPLLVMNCPTLTDPQKWFGRREVDEKGTRYEKSDFINAVEAGAVILLDEFMRLHPTIHNPVMSLLDGQETALLSDLNLQITRNPRTVFIGTTNQGAQFGGTHRMDWAMRERWSFTIERDFPPADEEVKILTAHNPGCDPDAAQVLVDIADKTRQMWQTGDLRSPISTRTLDNAAFLVASGMTEREALTYTALREFDGGAEGVVGQESDRAKVDGVIEGRVGSQLAYRAYAK